MADVERHRHGSQTLIDMPVLSGTVIEKGDFCALSELNETVVNVGAISDQGTATQNREKGADLFLGIAQTASASGETENVVIDISLESIHLLTLQTAAALSFGDFVEIYADTFACHDQLTVAGSTSGIAVCVQAKAAAGVDFLAKLTQQAKLNLEQT